MSTPSIISAIQQLRFFLTRKDKINLLWVAFLALCVSMLEVITATIIMIFAQVLNQPEISQKYLKILGLENHFPPQKAILYTAIIVGLVYVIKNIFAIVEICYQSFCIQKMNYRFKSKILSLYARTDYLLLLDKNASKRYNLIEWDVHQIFASGLISLASIFSEGAIFVALICLIICVDPSIFIAIFIISSLSILFLRGFLLPLFYIWGSDSQKADEKSTHHLLQFLHGLKEIILFGKTEHFIRQYETFSKKKSYTNAKQTIVSSLPRFIIEILFVGLFVSVIVSLCLENKISGNMFGILGGYLYTGFRLMPGANRLIYHLNTLKSVTPCINRVTKEYEQNWHKVNCQNIDSFTFKSAIVLKNVTFRYPRASQDILSDVSWRIEKGQCVGIVGETGSGKSTLVDILLGLINPIAGDIYIDDIFPVNCQQWHQKIGYVSQNIYLIDETIQANIAFGEEKVDFEKLDKAVNASQLRKFLDGLPAGLETIIGERGVRLSGGERQRIAIARALYHNPEVLIFDEATSALDTKTEEILMETIRAVSKNRTVIMIAHRLSTLKDCNQIIRVEDKKIKVVSVV